MTETAGAPELCLSGRRIEALCALRARRSSVCPTGAGVAGVQPARQGEPGFTVTRWIPSRALRWLLFTSIVLAAILVPFALFGVSITQWTEHVLTSERGAWSLGVIGALLLAGDIFLPTPSSVVSATLGALLGPFSGTLLSTAGMTLGVALGYVAGAVLGSGPTRRLVGAHDFDRLHALAERHGIFWLVICRPVPVLAEASVLVSGCARMHTGAVLGATTVANLGISTVYASLGELATKGPGFFLSIGIMVAISAVAWLFRVRLTRRPVRTR